MQLTPEIVEALLGTCDGPLFWCGVPADRWPAVRRRLHASGMDWLAAPVSGAGFQVIGTNEDIGRLTQQEAVPTIPNAALALLEASDLHEAELCRDWAYIVGVAYQQRPNLRLVRA